MTLTEQMTADVEGTYRDMPAEKLAFWFNEVEYIGQRTPMGESHLMDDAGYLQRIDFELTACTSQFSAIKPPYNRDEIQIKNEEGEKVSYFIERTAVAQDGVTIHYGVKQKT